ncbi:alpha-galactosidase [Paenibacillus ferrarius]|uniref:Alpha-galactosidase n=1 Tax=Paenibacillus ferrarius TaxID=1469647 RepID=A0A1V4HPV4_9BACL|nr:alpha-galactosidase [Paenibacillus ferrarius]OPH60282.1 alpha-galactosidase [Paenibacillus ferrarius]
MSIVYHEDLRLFEIQMRTTSYVFGLNDKGVLQQIYWGDAIDARECAHLLQSRHHSSFDAEVDREKEEYGGHGGSSYVEPCLKVRFQDGVRDLKLAYTGFAIEQDTLRVILKDVHYDLIVNLTYKVIHEHDLIERTAEVVNQSDTEVVIEQMMSAAWSLPTLPSYRLTHVSGRWSGEFQLRDTLLSEGKKTLESRRGFTGPHANPWFAVDNGKADEVSGKVWFGVLGWSGNWKIVAEKTNFNHVRVVGGMNDFDCPILLQGGECITSPSFIGGYTSRGFGDMSRQLHSYQRAFVFPSQAHRRVLYNSWEATYFQVEAQGQMELARSAAKLGVELFVVDDGWFGSRNSDQAGLGDWHVNAEKFPNGLQELIDEVTSLGMDFGIWVEPESVNPDSDLYRKHPDWVYQFPTREGTLQRNQLLLNLGKTEVKQYILDFMTELLSSYSITFIKWDMNRTLTEAGTADDIQNPYHAVWVKHVQSLYEIWAELRTKFPHVEFESCAGGGSRIDLGILRYADQVWPSDNTDAFDRLRIQEGFAYVYSPQVMMCWVTESPHSLNGRSLSLAFRFHSAMMGGLGIGADLKLWSEEEMQEAAAYIAQYKEIRHIIMAGHQYRLRSLRDSDVAAVQYVSKDGGEAVVFLFLHAQQFGNSLPSISLQGLEPNADYLVHGLEQEPVRFKGKNLMHVGLNPKLTGDYDSALIRLQRV